MDYPQDYQELICRFSSQASCLEYLASIRWAKGFTCPKCSANAKWKSKRSLWICSKCEFQSSPIAGTIFQDTKVGLPIWFQMMWWFVGQKSGANALSLQKNFGIGSYRTAWVILGKLRLCMVRQGREKLSGEVEVDEAFLGGTNNKKMFIVAAEIRGKGTGRIRMQRLESRAATEIQKFILEFIELDSTIVTDRLTSYVTISERGYTHRPQKKPKYFENASGDDDRHLPRVHRAISLLKRWFYGTYQGKIGGANLQHYLDEFVFRFNRRKSDSRGLLFYRLLEAALSAKPNPR